MEIYSILTSEIAWAILSKAVSALSFTKALNSVEESDWFSEFGSESIGEEQLAQLYQSIVEQFQNDIIEFSPNMGGGVPRENDDDRPDIDPIVKVPPPNRTPREYVKDLRETVKELADKLKGDQDAV